MKSCQMYRFIPIILLCVCLFTGGCSQNKDQPSATHNQTPATEAASHTDPPTGTYPAGRRHQNFYNRASHIHTVFTKIIVPFPLLPEMEPIRSVSTKMFPMTVTQRCSPRHFLSHLQIR